MKGKFLKTIMGSALSCLLASWLLAGTAFGLDLSLVAEEATVTMPDGNVITMWGLRDVNDPNHPAGEWQVPVFTTTDAVLSIALTNALPPDTANLAKPTSLIIPGLVPTETGAMVPTWTDGTSGSRFADPNDPQPAELQKRVRSITHETANGAGPVTYSWDLTPGTYLIQSGSHQALQVQMGLYAVLVVNAAADQAYGPESTFTSQQVLAYSEIDSALHAAVAVEDYGPGMTYSSTMNFHPDYYLINGQPFSANASPVQVGLPGDTVLLRFVNAGYETRVPVMQGAYFTLIAEDGNLLPYSREVYSVELPAGKTKDAVWTSAASGVTNLYDGRFHLTNQGVSGGGLLVKLAAIGQGGLLAPNGGETYVRGTTYTVSWVLDPAANDYRLTYFDADGTVHRLGSVGNVNSYDWTVPLDAVTEAGKSFRVAAFNGASLLGADFSDGTFSVVSQMSPNGGETLTEGMTYQLTWGPVPGADSYRLRYFDADNTIHVIANLGNVTDHAWTVPFDALAEPGKRFRVTAFAGGAFIPRSAQWSEGTFTIASQLFPNGGEALMIGQTYPLTWAAVPGADRYRVFYFDADGTPHLIAFVLGGTTYDWTVPADVVAEAGKKFRVTAFNGATYLDVAQWSDGTFTVSP